jgi:hypothetical protein
MVSGLENIATRDELSTFNKRLIKNIHNLKIDNIKWMFVFAVLQICSNVFIFYCFLK